MTVMGTIDKLPVYLDFCSFIPMLIVIITVTGLTASAGWLYISGKPFIKRIPEPDVVNR